jgi:hypothetical protein
MKNYQIKAIQSRVGATPDGFWGPKSIAACQAHLRRLMPTTNPWPKSDDVSMTRFYGKAGDESILTNLDVSGLGIKYNGASVRTVRCHKKVAESLHRILTNISKSDHKWVLEEYAGCFNHRPMRGGSRPSKHSWGVAIDLAPDTNSLKASWPTASSMPLEVMEIFAHEGWISAGAFGGRDGMHHEACS